MTPTQKAIQEAQKKLLQARRYRGIPADGNFSEMMKMKNRPTLEPTPSAYLLLAFKDRPEIAQRLVRRLGKLRRAS